MTALENFIGSIVLLFGIAIMVNTCAAPIFENDAPRDKTAQSEVKD